MGHTSQPPAKACNAPTWEKVDADRIKKFIDYAATLQGDEKGEAQVFCDRLFKAFGHNGYKEAGATLEYRIKQGTKTTFPDLVWKGRGERRH